MTNDPNWFYSSIAQCTAAIIGLLGAILATKLQSQLIDVKPKYRSLTSSFSTLTSQLSSVCNQMLSNPNLTEVEISLLNEINSLSHKINSITDIKTLENKLTQIIDTDTSRNFAGEFGSCVNWISGIYQENEDCKHISVLTLPIVLCCLLIWLTSFGLIITFGLSKFAK